MRLFLTVFQVILIRINVQFCGASNPLNNENPSTENTDDVRAFRESFTKRMESYMNTSVDPCDDFYAYACGNYPNVVEDNEVFRKQNALYNLSHVIDDFIDLILQKERQPDEKYYKELQIVKKFLEVCDNADLWPLKPSEEYLELIKSIGGFPAVDQTWNASAFDWFNMTAHLVRYGVVGLIKEEIFLKHPFPPYYEIPRFGFDFDVYADNIVSNESLGYVHNVKIMRDILGVYGVNDSEAEEVIEDILELWREVMVLQDKALDRSSCRRLSLEDGLDDYEFPKWNSLFQIAWNASDFSIFDSSDCPCHWYFKQLDEISANRSEALANYMALKFLYSLHPLLKSIKFQHRHCVTQVKLALPLVLTRLYLKEHFSKEDQQEVEEMIIQLKVNFVNLIDKSDWLDDHSRTGNKRTINNLKVQVGEVVDPISETYINETNRLKFTDNYAINFLELAKFQIDMRHYAFMHLRLNNNTAPFEVLNAIQVNAFYDLYRNGITVLAGILFPPIYHRHMPKSAKYGSLGYVIGHEIMHSLEFRGFWFEKTYRNHSFWSKKLVEVLDNRTECFVKHHNNYTLPVLEIRLNRTKNTRESVADSGGLREALETYRAVFKEAVKNMVPDFEQNESLLGLTPDQTFFVSFAQVYCAKYEPRHYWSEIYEDHPMDRYRVISPLQNFEEFSVVYNCSLGSPMNPKDKCRVW